jgi:hypothetical protein
MCMQPGDLNKDSHSSRGRMHVYGGRGHHPSHLVHDDEEVARALGLRQLAQPLVAVGARRWLLPDLLDLCEAPLPARPAPRAQDKQFAGQPGVS